ncbi:Hydrolase of the alpha/beta superfamily [Winogradskyella psychrotolerans RS-3]|uniref:Hydrolase of the alpha/beta superfamily n=1 Tax=Winogradskyella psychrotolerans RS-3 TaxID=641526 RepID=S7VY08_9FLAO|nr:alpha/beta fold hydrolase [Winogradskyella psychrotolerans]EPR74307.1 Hydrolase of the alpha/beta superfamily [Winogradskyella psychrotolerans RS-3]
MKKNRKTKFIKRVLLILTIAGLILIHFVFPRFIMQTRNPIAQLFKTEKVINAQLESNDNSKFKRKKLTIITFDNLKLSALLTYSSLQNTKGTIILLHGSSHNKDHFLGLSEFLATNGFNSVALDSRGFGESEGQFLTYGVKETKDIQTLISQLIKDENLGNIGLWGQSIGGAFTLQAMGMDKRIKYGIAESSYKNLKTNIQYYFKRHAGFNLELFSNYLVDRAGRIADFNPDDANPYKYSENITQPILVVHGGKDKPIPITNGKANFSRIKSIDKEFIEIESAGHSDLWETGGEDYFNSVLKFLNRQALSSN